MFWHTPIHDSSYHPDGIQGTLYVPASLVSAYKSNQWFSVYSDHIVGI